MDKVIQYGIDINAPSSEAIPKLISLPLHVLMSLREDLFAEALSQGLSSEGDALVARRDSRKKPLYIKLADDIVSLLICIKNGSILPRTLLKNGKRSKEYLNASRNVEAKISQESSSLSQSPSFEVDSINGSVSSFNNFSSLSSLMKDINLLKDDIKGLKSELSLLHRHCESSSSSSLPSFCHVRVLFTASNCPPFSNVSSVSALLGCPALQVTKVSDFSLKVKIPKECLHSALLSGNINSHHVQVWRHFSKVPSHSTKLCTSVPTRKSLSSLSIATWNCRGLNNSIPYIRELLLSGIDIIVLQEHWLWPFQHDQLASINSSYSFCAVSDNRLNSDSDLRRGCGGVSILWKKDLNVTLLPHINSDRICAIQLALSGSSLLTIIGIYMPSSDYPQDEYISCLEAVDTIISRLSPDDPLLVVGDLNCHLGPMGGHRSSDSTNSRGILWKELIDNHSLYVPSQSDIATGPTYTYSSGGSFTTLDYIIGNAVLASYLTSCRTIEDHSLNTSDHLPLSVKLNIQSVTNVQRVKDKPSLNWNRSRENGSCDVYAQRTDSMVKPLLDKDYSSIEEIEKDLSFFTESLYSIATETIPHYKTRDNSHESHVKDSFLSSLCYQSRVAFREWKASGRPTSGSLYEKRKKCKRDVASYLSKCRARLERYSLLSLALPMNAL